MPDETHWKVVVAGDVTIDWNLVHEGSRGRGGGWDPASTSALSRQPGGASLLAELLEGITRRRATDFEGAWDVVPPLSPGRATSPSSPRVHHSYVLWALQDATDGEQAWRVARFLGLNRRRSDVPARTPHGGPAADEPTADIVVLTDAGLGFNRRPDLWPGAITTAAEQPWVVLRVAPLDLETHAWDDSPLLGRVLESHAERTIVVLDVEDLRSGDIQVARGISWERTALDLLGAATSHECLSVFRNCAQVVVSLGTAGAFGYRGIDSRAESGGEGEPGPSAWLVFDPLGLEGSFEVRYPGEMVGLGTCLTAGLVYGLMRGDRPGPFGEGLEAGARNGVRAARRLHEGGYRIVRSDRRPTTLRFPVARVADALAASDGDDSGLVSVKIPPRAARLECPACDGRMRPPQWTILEARHGQDVRGVASRILRRGLDSVMNDVPRLSFGGLVTLDRREIEAYRVIAGLLLRYSHAARPKRPLSIAVFGPPGSGKSFGVKQIAKAIAPDRIESIEFNLSQLAGPAGLVDALHQVRDVGLSGGIPLVFWDEFDTELEGRLGWLRYFLAPMWDGVFQHGQITHAIGPAIFIFAGGTKPGYADFVAHADLDDDEWSTVKGPDFVSRLGGYLDVLGPNSLGDPAAETYAPDPYYPIRRAIILRSLLERGYPQLFARGGGGGLGEISMDAGVLQALLGVSAYHHGARSMEAVLAGSALAGRRHFDRTCLPLASQLEMHVNSQEFESLIERWVPDEPLLTEMARTNHELFCERLRSRDFRLGPRTDEEARTHSSLVEWEELPPDEQEQNRDFVRSIPDKLASIGYRVVRTAASRTADEIDPKIMEDVLEALAEEEHDRWVGLKLDGGWSWGETSDKPHRIHPDILPWEYVGDDELEKKWGAARAACIGKRTLSKTAKDKDRELVESIPTILERHGFTIAPVDGAGR